VHRPTWGAGTLAGVDERPRRLPVGLDRWARRRWPLLAGWSAAQWWLVADHTGDWAYFQGAARAMFGGSIGTHHLPGGIHTYANAPSFQFGPPAVVLAEPATWFGTLGRPIYEIAIMALCLPTLWMLEAIAVELGRPPESARRFTLLAGALLVHAWGLLAFGASHMDDALVLVGAVATAFLCLRQRPYLAAGVAGTAVAAKPWGLFVLVLLLQVEPRRRLPALAVAGAVALAWWSPFLLDPHTVSAVAGARVGINDNTVLHLILPGAHRMPPWVRPAQLAGGVVVGTWLALHGRIWSVPLVAIALRIVIDPGGYDYYWCGLTVAAMLHDNAERRRLPLATVLSTVPMLLSFQGFPSRWQAIISAVGLVGCVVTVLRRRLITSPRCPSPHPVP
jgi:hypothetical protein